MNSIIAALICFEFAAITFGLNVSSYPRTRSKCGVVVVVVVNAALLRLFLALSCCCCFFFDPFFFEPSVATLPLPLPLSPLPSSCPRPWSSPRSSYLTSFSYSSTIDTRSRCCRPVFCSLPFKMLLILLVLCCSFIVVLAVLPFFLFFST